MPGKRTMIMHQVHIWSCLNCNWYVLRPVWQLWVLVQSLWDFRSVIGVIVTSFWLSCLPPKSWKLVSINVITNFCFTMILFDFFYQSLESSSSFIYPINWPVRCMLNLLDMKKVSHMLSSLFTLFLCTQKWGLYS